MNKTDWFCNVLLHHGVEVTKPSFLSLVIFPIFQNDYNIDVLYEILLIFDRCHHSWWSDKYEHDWKYVTYTFAKSKFPVTEKLLNKAFVTPTLNMQVTYHDELGNWFVILSTYLESTDFEDQCPSSF